MARLFADENFPLPVVEALSNFVRLHDVEPNHAGIIVCSFDLDFDGQAERIDQAVATQESMVGRLIRVNRPQG